MKHTDATGEPEYLTTDEFAARIRMTPEYVRRQCKAGKIPNAKRLGKEWRIHRSSVEQFMSGTGVVAAARPLSARQRKRAAVT